MLRPHEDKPTLGDAAHNGAVLKHIADGSGQPVFSIAFDFKYYFHQLWYAASQLPLMGMIMPEPGTGGGASSRTGCYSEHVMAMGMHASSGYAQRFGNVQWMTLTMPSRLVLSCLGLDRSIDPKPGNLNGVVKTHSENHSWQGPFFS